MNRVLWRSDPDGVTSYMCYMYSGNNPVSYSDPSGFSIRGNGSMLDGPGDDLDSDDNIGPGPEPQSSSPETQSPSAPSKFNWDGVPSGVAMAVPAASPLTNGGRFDPLSPSFAGSLGA
jgi:hypothetical protein